MERLTLPSRTPSPVIRCRPPHVYVAGRRRRDLDVRSVELLAAPEFGRARVALHPPAGLAERGRLERLGVLPAVGIDLTIRPRGGLEFAGVVTTHAAGAGADAETLEAEVRHVLAVVLGEPISGRWELDGEARPVHVPRARCVFNGTDAGASTALGEIAGRSARVFDAGGAVRWTVADALGYLLAVGVPSHVRVPDVEELRDLTANVDPGRVDVPGLSVAETLVRVARRGGLALRAARDGLGLVFYRPGRDGRRLCVRQQPAGESLDRSRSNLARAALRFERRPSRRPVLAVGDHKRYETTLVLCPGWDPQEATGRWRDTTRGLADDWPRRAEVYRRWVLNEHGGYDGPPWSLPRYDFADLGEDFFLPAPRRLGPCVSTDATGAGLGVVVEWRGGDGEAWRRWAGPAYAAPDECAVYLGGDALPGAYFQAAAAGTAEVRVTATVASDARLSVEIPGDRALRREVIELPDRGQWRAVHATSVFAGGAAPGEPRLRDDTDRLRRIAERHARTGAHACDAELTLAWVEPSCTVGDRVDRIGGRALELATRADRDAVVTAVRHTW
ncbi:MAG: hypothetical protein ACOC8F_04225, partial [Planctomycetota bacterium]